MGETHANGYDPAFLGKLLNSSPDDRELARDVRIVLSVMQGYHVGSPQLTMLGIEDEEALLSTKHRLDRRIENYRLVERAQEQRREEPHGS
jgi:hypothetical protein